MANESPVIVDADSLCESCAMLPPVRLLKGHFQTLHRNYAELCVCNCSFCKLLCEEIVRTTDSERRDSMKYATDDTVEIYGNLHDDLSRRESLSLITGYYETQLYLSALSDDPSSKYIRGRSINRNPSSERTLSLVEKWTDDCQHNHKECARPAGGEMPTFLIDLEAPDLYKKSALRLIRTDEVSDDCKYVALSYVWGVAHQPVMLTLASYPGMIQQFPEDDLPQTHKDAIFVSRRMNIRYLWIDALCIIQDDPKEKRREITLMHHIFGNSTLTIQAGRSHAVGEGFLGARQEPDVPLHKLRYGASEDSGYVFLRGGQGTSRDDGTVGSRAWCFEESVLSRKLLVFGRYQLIYKCLHSYRAEDGTQGTSGNPGSPGFLTPAPWYDGLPLPKELKLQDPKFDALKLWYTTLDHQYTLRLLTKSRDRLLAIAGVVQRLEGSIGGEYRHGLWFNDLPWALLWQCRRGLSPNFLNGELKAYWKQRPNAMIKMPPSSTKIPANSSKAPSWSWGALLGGTHHDFGHRFYKPNRGVGKRLVVSTVAYDLGRNAGPDTNPTFDLILHISGPLRKVELVHEDNNAYQDLRKQVDGKSFTAYRGKVLMVANLDNDRANKTHSDVLGTAQLDLAGNDLTEGWALLMVDGQGLLLELVAGKASTYRRKGVFYTIDHLQSSSFGEEFKETIHLV